jgi:hypothetical protein
MSFDLTDLHTLIVRAHDRYNIPIGKVMRVTLQAAAGRKFPLNKSDGSGLKLNVTERQWLCGLASTAEQQTGVRWWTKHPWSRLRAVLVSEPKFWKWFNGEFGAPKATLAAMATPTIAAVAPAKTKSASGAKSQAIEEAIEVLWMGNIPKGLTAKERNRKILGWLVANNRSRPTNPQRAIQRVLKARHPATKQMS